MSVTFEKYPIVGFLQDIFVGSYFLFITEDASDLMDEGVVGAKSTGQKVSVCYGDNSCLKGYSEIIAVTAPSMFIKSKIFAFW